MTHECPIYGCTTQLARSLLMCARHWRKVPHDLKDAVNSTWRVYQNTVDPKGGELMRLRRAYLYARAAAIAWVNG